MYFVPFLQAAPQGSTAGQFGSLIVTVVMMIAIFYFFLIRPQSKRQKEQEKMMAALKKGDKVVTIGGIHGTIASTKDKTVVVKVDDSTKIEFNRTAIASVVNEDKKADKKSEKDDSSKEEK